MRDLYRINQKETQANKIVGDSRLNMVSISVCRTKTGLGRDNNKSGVNELCHGLVQ